MKTIVKRSVLVLFMSLVTTGLFSQDKKNSAFQPQVGQAGKDVIWVPTPDELVQKMLEIAKVTPSDYVIDLGSGDGRTVIAAAKLNAKATGIEYNPEMVELSKKKAEEAGVSDKANFIKADLFEFDLSQATVITMFLLPDINIKLRPKILDLKPGTRIVSNTFTMGEWTPDLEVTVEGSGSWNTALLWIVPAKVEGTWKMGQGEMTIRQEFQKFTGSYKADNKTSTINDGMLNASEVSFRIGNSQYTGKVTGNNKITGTVTTGSGKTGFTATKIE